MSRRAVIGLGLGLAGAAAAGGVAVYRRETDTCADADVIPFLPARPAASLLDAFGVVVHLHFRRSAYGQTGRVVDAIEELGARHVRSRLSPMPSVTAGFAAFAANGVLVDGVCGAFGDPETMDSILRHVVAEYEDPLAVFSAFEGINEPNNDGRPWIEETRQKIIALHEARSRYRLEEVPIIGPALARVNGGGVAGGDTQGQSIALGDLTPWIDLGNIHVYPRGLRPSQDIDEFVGYQRAVARDLPLVCTEGGYFTAENYVGGARSTPEDVVRRYLPRQLLEHWSRDIRRFYYYELLDDPDPDMSDREARFGLIGVSGTGPRDTWTPKSRFRAMRNFLGLLADDAAGTPPPGLQVRLDGCGSDLRSALLARRDGVFVLCLWRDLSLYDQKSGESTEPDARVVAVTLAAPAVLRVYEPSTHDRTVRTVGAATRIDVSVAGEVVALVVDPSSPAAATQPRV